MHSAFPGGNANDCSIRQMPPPTDTPQQPRADPSGVVVVMLNAAVALACILVFIDSYFSGRSISLSMIAVIAIGTVAANGPRLRRIGFGGRAGVAGEFDSATPPVLRGTFRDPQPSDAVPSQD